MRRLFYELTCISSAHLTELPVDRQTQGSCHRSAQAKLDAKRAMRLDPFFHRPSFLNCTDDDFSCYLEWLSEDEEPYDKILKNTSLHALE